MNRKKLAFSVCTSLVVVSCGSSPKETQPNILLIVMDDMGYSDIEPYGGEIRTPNISELSQQGTQYTRFHASSMSAPTRAMLLTGVDNHLNGFGAMPPMAGANQYMQKGYEGSLNDNVVTIGQILQQHGYFTFTAGKWHMGHHPGSLAGDRGFDKSFVLMAGGTSHFDNTYAMCEYDTPVTYYCQDDVRLDKLPRDFYSTTHYTDKVIEYLDTCPKDQPFMGYMALTAPHDPLHIIEEWADKYAGVYDKGYDEVRKSRHDRLKELGVIPSSTPYYPIESGQWDDLSQQQKREQARKMEIYAAMVEYADYSIGRVINHLKAIGRYDNTLIIFMSDNGSNPKEPHFYPGNSKEQIATTYNNSLENYGNKDSFISLGKAWAEVTSTPYSNYKMMMSEGGMCTPMIIAGGDFAKGKLDTQSLLHVSDIVPTILSHVGVGYEYKGRELAPLYGKKIEPNGSSRNSNDALCFEMIEDKAIIKGDWKAYQRSKFNAGDSKTWFLYNLKDDIAEKVDLAAKHPRLLDSLVEQWCDYASSVGYIEFDGKMLNQSLSPQEYYGYDPKNKQE